MKILEKIKSPIKKEMDLFEEKFSSSMISDVPLLNRITHYVVKRKGKQMRPMFVFLSAKIVSDEIVGDKVFRAASIIELIHTATLIHDDIVDDSSLRRGFLSLNALWNNKISVLVGDYLLSKSLLLCIDNEDFDLLKIISTAAAAKKVGAAAVQGAQGVGKGLAKKVAAKNATALAKAVLKKGASLPMPVDGGKTADFKIDDLKGDEVTLTNPKPKPGEPIKTVHKTKELDPIIQQMVQGQQ